MEAGRIILAGISFAVAGLGAAWDVVIVRPVSCAAEKTYLLAGNSAAIIRIEADALADTDGVIVYREQSKGWASRRLLGRFDLSLDDAGATIVNSGDFCRGSQ